MKVYAKVVALAAIATVLVFASAAAVTLTVQSAKATVAPCDLCAKDFAPGIEAISPGDAKNFAPGQEAKVPLGGCPACAKDFAPGQVKKQPT